MVTVLGYVSYFFICLFSPVQFVAMLRGKNINFGVWPLVSLSIGLALLSLSFFFVTVPMYVLVGQYISLTFTLLLLARVIFFSPPVVQQHKSNMLEKYAEKTLRDNIFDGSAFFNFMKKRTGTLPKTPEEQSDTAQVEPFNFKEPEPWLRRQDFAPCTECGSLVFAVEENTVEIAAYDFSFALGRAFQSLPPYDNLVQIVRLDYFCKADHPPYDRVVYTPQVEGETVVEYYHWDKSTVALNMPPVLRQVTEEGEQFD